MCAGKFERHPEERHTDAGQLDASARQTLNTPSEKTSEDSPDHGDQKQDAPAARYGEAAVNGEDCCDPRHRSQDEKERVKETTPKRDERARAEDGQEENSKANPGINAEISAGVGE